MIRKTLITACLVVFQLALYAQDQAAYVRLTSEAEKLYHDKDFAASAKAYSKAFAVMGGKGTQFDRYNAACSWALAGQPDSSFVQLFRIAEKANFSDEEGLKSDPDLETLRHDKRWDKLVVLVHKNREIKEAKYNRPLIAELDSILTEDQKYRQHVREVGDKYGWESDEMKDLWKVMEEADSSNLLRITAILDEYGWLGADVVGESGNATLFLVIQHADHETQEKYLPMMREAVAKGNAPASSLALLEDRVALGEGKKQIYGSQIGHNSETDEYYVQALEDPDHVDERRASVGLGPLADYVSHYNIKWDVEEYKKKLPEIEARRKR